MGTKHRRKKSRSSKHKTRRSTKKPRPSPRQLDATNSHMLSASLTLARAQAMKYLRSVMWNETEPTQLRVRAATMLLQNSTPSKQGPPSVNVEVADADLHLTAADEELGRRILEKLAANSPPTPEETWEKTNDAEQRGSDEAAANAA